MHFQWYPGHMTKARRMMQENIKLIDLIIELVDARVPLSSRNPDIDELGKNKARLILLNKILFYKNQHSNLIFFFLCPVEVSSMQFYHHRTHRDGNSKLG